MLENPINVGLIQVALMLSVILVSMLENHDVCQWLNPNLKNKNKYNNFDTLLVLYEKMFSNYIYEIHY
jgi:hypothetical protein